MTFSQDSVCYCLNPRCQNRQNSYELHNCASCGTSLLVNERYRLIRPLRDLNVGYETEIFEVEDWKDLLTLKVLKVLNSRNADVVNCLKREASALIALSLHEKGVPRVEPDGYFTVGLGNGNRQLHCLVMEEIEGCNLEEWREENGAISQELAVKWLRQLIVILEQIHQQNLLHRDIKPSNIMLREDGQLVLIDFGLVGVGPLGATVVGTHGYTAPEQWDGHAVKQSDFFALGRTFVYLFTGEHPFNLPIDSRTNQLLWRDRAPQVEEWFANLIDKLMAREWQHRPRNTQVILNRLRKPPLGLDWQKVLLAGAAVPLLAMGVLQLKRSSERLDPRRFSVTLNNRGFDDFLAGDKAEASQKFNEAIQQNPQNRAAYYNQAWECEAIRNFDCATGNYQIAAKLGMDAAYSQLARLYILQENDYNAAAEISREGLRIVKNDTVKYALLKNLGWARLGQGRYREAKENLENAIALDSNRAAAYCLFAQVLEAENDLKKAQNQWKRCQQYVDQENPDEDVWLGIARKRLTAGGEES